jgi:hypothetical protein
MEPVIGAGDDDIDPSAFWVNVCVLRAMQQDGIGLVTGQETIDGVLNAMDSAWQLGPS